MKKILAMQIVGWGAAAASLAGAQTGNPVQDAINRDAMNAAVLRQATGNRPQAPRGVPAGARALFGRWVAMPETTQLPNVGSGGCTMVEITFTATTEVRVFPGGHSYPSYSRKSNITYANMNARSFYVVPEGSTVGPYVEIVDSQHIRPEYPDLCLYRRAG